MRLLLTLRVDHDLPTTDLLVRFFIVNGPPAVSAPHRLCYYAVPARVYFPAAEIEAR